MLALDPDILPAANSAAGVPAAAVAAPTRQSGDPVSLDEAERRHIEAVLRQTGGVIEGPAGAATILELHPNTLRSRMKKLGVRRPA